MVIKKNERVYFTNHDMYIFFVFWDLVRSTFVWTCKLKHKSNVHLVLTRICTRSEKSITENCLLATDRRVDPVAITIGYISITRFASTVLFFHEKKWEFITFKFSMNTYFIYSSIFAVLICAVFNLVRQSRNCFPPFIIF